MREYREDIFERIYIYIERERESIA